MSRGFRRVQQINRPVAEVWRKLTNWSDAAQWMPGIDRLHQVDDGDPQEGTELRFASRGAERSTRVTTWEPDRRLALTSTQGGITAVYRYTLEAQGEGTTVTLEASCQARGFFWKLMHPLIGWLMERADGSQLDRFKAMVEGT